MLRTAPSLGKVGACKTAEIQALRPDVKKYTRPTALEGSKVDPSKQLRSEYMKDQWPSFLRGLRGILIVLGAIALIGIFRTTILSFQDGHQNVLVAAKKIYSVPYVAFYKGESDHKSAKFSKDANNEATKEFYVHSKQMLIDCVKFHFHQRKYYIKQKKHDPLAVRLQLDLIARQMCFSDISLFASLEEFSDLKLTASETSSQAYVSEFAHNESHYFSPGLTEVLCRARSKIFFTQKGKITGTGMGSRLHLIATQLHLILAYNNPPRILAFEPGGWVYTNSNLCEEADLRCYFQPMSQCLLKEASLNPDETKYWHSGRIPRRMDRWSDQTSSRSRKKKAVLPLIDDGGNGPTSFVYKLPEIYASRGWLWYYSQIFYFMFQPNESVQQEFSNLRLSFKDHIESESSIFIHIRRGDKYTESHMFDDESYITSAKILEKQKYSLISTTTSSLFIATDDANVYDQMKINHSKDFRFNHILKSSYSDKAFASLSASKLDGSEEAMAIFREIFMAISSDMFIGSFSSGLSRLIFKLMVAVQGETPPNISLSTWTKDVNGIGPRLSVNWL